MLRSPFIRKLWKASVFPERVGGSGWRDRGKRGVWLQLSKGGRRRCGCRSVKHEKTGEMFSSKLQQLSGGPELMCNVSHSGGQTTYSIQNMPDFTDTSKFEFSWITADNHVLANHVGQMQQVMSRSFDSLVTSTCFQNVACEGHVILERTVQDYSVNCTTVCPQKAPDDDEAKFLSTAILVILAFLVLAGLMVCFLLSRRIQKNVQIPADVLRRYQESR